MEAHHILKIPQYVQLYTSLWNNPSICIGRAPVYWRRWHSSGILTLGDLYKDGVFISFQDLIQKFKLEGKINFWKYLQIKSCITSKCKLGGVAENCILDYLDMPQGCHTASQFYKMIGSSISDESSNVKLIWQQDLRQEFSQDRWLKILSDCGKHIKEARVKFIQYKILHRYYHTPSRLYRMKLLKDNFCWKCKTEVGTFLHCIWECSLVAPF